MTEPNASAAPTSVGPSLQASVEAALQAQHVGDLKTALIHWQNLRERFPDDPRGFAGSGTVLRQLRRLDDADLVLADAIARFPRDEKIAVARAWVAHARGDLPEANRRWTTVLESFPSSFDGFFGGGSILKALRRFDEADELYRLALSRMPVSPGLLGDFAAVAQARGDALEASRRWIVLHTLFPGRLDCLLRQARALREANLYGEAEPILIEALKISSRNSGALIEFALNAQHGGQSGEALKRWELVISEFPGLVDGYVGAAHALNAFGRFADALNVLQPAARKFPDSVAAASLVAWTEHYRGNYSNAVSCWNNMRARFPSNAASYTGGAASLLASGNADQATTLLENATRLFPRDVQIAMQWARIPQQLQNWQDAASRWKMALESFPDSHAVVAGYALCLCKGGNSADAEQMLEVAIDQHCGSFDLVQAFAECSGHRRDWPVAVARWRNVVDKFPDRLNAWIGLGEALRNTGSLDESERILADASKRFPNNLELERHFALTATAQRDWGVALPLWEKLKRKYPRNPSVLSGITQAVWRAQQDMGAMSTENVDGAVPFEIPACLLEIDGADEDSDAVRGLLMRFESIGDTCEFGIVQRRFGAEPISLLRWASTPPAKLVIALNTKFEGVGEAEHTIIQVLHGEYTTQDRRYHMFSHTFTPESAEPLERFTVQHLRRMKYLRKKLVEDLGTGEKIFVFKSNQSVSDEDAIAIFRGIRQYGGAAALLCVRLADEAHPTGTVFTLESGLFIGYIDRFSTVDINIDVWVQLCGKTDKLWQSTLKRPAVSVC